jgi:hypothetical protein
MSEWCGPTAELPNQALAKLLSRSRRPTRRTDPSAPLTDPWFEDSQPIASPEVDPSQPIDLETRRRKSLHEMMPLRKPPVYPVYRTAMTTIMWTIIVLGALGAIAAYFLL